MFTTEMELKKYFMKIVVCYLFPSIDLRKIFSPAQGERAKLVRAEERALTLTYRWNSLGWEISTTLQFSNTSLFQLLRNFLRISFLLVQGSTASWVILLEG